MKPKTTTAKQKFRKEFESRALAVFRDGDGNRVAYGWTFDDLWPLIEALAETLPNNNGPRNQEAPDVNPAH